MLYLLTLVFVRKEDNPVVKVGVRLTLVTVGVRLFAVHV